MRKYLFCICILSGLLLTLSGCIRIFPDQPPQQKVLLLNPGPIHIDNHPPVDWQLVVLRPTTNAFLDKDLIGVQDKTSTANYVKGAMWPNELPEMVQNLLLDAFISTKKFRGVGSSTAALIPQYAIAIDIDHFGLLVGEGMTEAPIVTVDFHAQLLDYNTRCVVDNEQFKASRRAKSAEVTSVIDTFNDILNELFHALASWVLTHQRLH